MPTTCPCGSGMKPFILKDARGIECGWVCEVCVDKKKAQYRPEIFENSNYEADEQIEPEEEL